MARVILGGDELGGFSIDRPAASIRLLLPTDGELEIPRWQGNEFLLSNGTRPIIRTFTPREFNPDSLELHIDVVLHGSGVASTWAENTLPDDTVAVSGPGRGYEIDPDATAFLIAGDETAIPAICQLLEHLPDVPITIHISVSHSDAMVDLHRDVDITWHVESPGSVPDDSFLQAITSAELVPATHIWAAGEAKSMQRIRSFLFREIEFPRSQATVRGYWKDDSR